MGFLSGILSVALGLMVLGAALAGFFVWVGANMAGVARAGFGRCVLVAIASSATTWLSSLIFSVLPVLGTFLGLLVGLLLSLLVIKILLSISFGRALLVRIFHLVAQVLTIVIGVVTFAGVLLEALRR